MRLLRLDSLAGRTVWLLVGGLGLLHLGSMAVHERALHGAELTAFEDRLADRVLAAAAVAAHSLPPRRAEAVAALSLPRLSLSWQAEAPAAPVGPGDALAGRVGRLGSDAVALGDPAEGRGALPVPGAGWVVFSARAPGPHGFPGDPAEWLSLLAMALGTFLVALPVVAWMTGPLQRLAAAADRIGRDPREIPLTTEGPIEVRQAARAFNAMQARILRLIEDRTEALAALSHDLRTPLARLRIRASFLPEGEDRARMEAGLEELEAMVDSVLAFFREGRDAEAAVPTDLVALLQTLADEAADAGQDVAFDGPARLVLPLRRVAARRALRNLLGNALLHGAEPVRLSLRREAGMAVVEIADAGPGIPPADRARALQPFVRLDGARGGAGTGLGLATAQRFADAAQGTLELDAAPGGGLLVRLRLPMAG